MLGGTSGMGRALARRLGARGDRLALLGRDRDRLERSARDLEIRGAPVPVVTFELDLEHPEGFEPAVDRAVEELGGLDVVVVTAATFVEQDRLEADRELARRLLTVDFTHAILFCEVARERLLSTGGGTLCVFSSVAGDRGRKPTVIYGAAKAGLSRYLEGLDHRWHARGLRVVCVKPGFVETPMTVGLDPPPFVGDPDEAAKDVVRAIDRGRPVVYTPSIYRWIMLAVRSLPRWLMRRTSF